MGEVDQDSFAGRLTHLITMVHPPDREPYSYREIAAGIAARGGPTMSAQYINQLARGSRGKNGVKSQYVHALAGFFGVPDEYFLDKEVSARVDSQVAQLAAWRDEEATDIAERAMTLGPTARRTVSNLIDNLRAYENEPRPRRRRRKPTTSKEPPAAGHDT